MQPAMQGCRESGICGIRTAHPGKGLVTNLLIYG